MKKLIITVAILMSFFSGRSTEQIKQNDHQQNIMSSGSFNQETYVWESFIFNTNSTSRTNK